MHFCFGGQSAASRRGGRPRSSVLQIRKRCKIIYFMTGSVNHRSTYPFSLHEPPYDKEIELRGWGCGPAVSCTIIDMNHYFTLPTSVEIARWIVFMLSDQRFRGSIPPRFSTFIFFYSSFFLFIDMLLLLSRKYNN